MFPRVIFFSNQKIFRSSPAVSGELPQGTFRDVWAHNLNEEFFEMLEIAKNYRFIAMVFSNYKLKDTEYPGTVVKGPLAPSSTIFQYPTVSANVNLLKLIQLGLSFFDENGNQPEGSTTWQFNFKFTPGLDISAADSLKMLIDSGFDFTRNDEEGVDPVYFSELLYSSDLIMNPNIRWITFHGSSDFTYLVRMLVNTNLPPEEDKFFPLLNIFFPRIYDLKYMIKDCRDLTGGLQYICDCVGVVRCGSAHHAGSDSLTTGRLFFKILERYFENCIFEDKYCGQLWGYNKNDSFHQLKTHYGEKSVLPLFICKQKINKKTND